MDLVDFELFLVFRRHLDAGVLVRLVPALRPGGRRWPGGPAGVAQLESDDQADERLFRRVRSAAWRLCPASNDDACRKGKR